MTDLLTERQAAERIAIPVSTLRYWRSTGEGPNFVKIGKYVRYDANTLTEFVQRNLHVSNAAATVEEAMRHVGS